MEKKKEQRKSRYMMTYLEKMRDLRERNGFTQEDVANYLGSSQAVYSRYERGENELPVHHLIPLCLLYHVSADQFLGIHRSKEVMHAIESAIAGKKAGGKDIKELSLESRIALQEFADFLKGREMEKNADAAKISDE